MTAPGKRITVERCVVTGVRIEPGFGRLTIEGVDQGKDGQTLQGHVLDYPPLVIEPDVAKAVATILEFAQRQVDEA